MQDMGVGEWWSLEKSVIMLSFGAFHDVSPVILRRTPKRSWPPKSFEEPRHPVATPTRQYESEEVFSIFRQH